MSFSEMSLKPTGIYVEVTLFYLNFIEGEWDVEIQIIKNKIDVQKIIL